MLVVNSLNPESPRQQFLNKSFITGKTNKRIGGGKLSEIRCTKDRAKSRSNKVAKPNKSGKGFA